MTAPLAHPSPGVDHEVVERARALQPVLAGNAARADAERRIPQENIDALEDAALLALHVPTRNGGLGATIATGLAVAAELAKGCASTAWVQTLVSIVSWAPSGLGADTQKEIFHGGTPARFCGALTAAGAAVATDDGWRLTGRWPFASGSLHANWAAVATVLQAADGAALGPAMVHVPMGDLAVDDTWHVTGMRGTGSNTLVADDVLVPDAYVLPLFEAARYDGEPAPSDRWPTGSALAVVLLGTLLGAADAALAAVAANAPRRGVAYTTLTAQTESPVLLHDIAHAALDIETARLHAFRCADQIDAIGAGAAHGPVDDARLRGACGYATNALRSAMDTLVNTAGVSCFAEANPIQRHWRDLNVASRHAFLVATTSLETYGRALFDRPPIMLMV